MSTTTAPIVPTGARETRGGRTFERGIGPGGVLYRRPVHTIAGGVVTGYPYEGVRHYQEPGRYEGPWTPTGETAPGGEEAYRAALAEYEAATAPRPVPATAAEPEAPEPESETPAPAFPAEVEVPGEGTVELRRGEAFFRGEFIGPVGPATGEALVVALREMIAEWRAWAANN